jgi:dihydrofolate synthase/folylpolyglutamate synthase
VNKIQTLEEAMSVFLAYAPTDMKGHYKLDRIQALLRHLDNPQEKLKVIHIAGTSGKTSTAYFIRGLIEMTGRRTGLTVSPHITAINERVQIDGMPLEPSRFIAYTNEFMGLVAQTDLKPTYFELLIAMAFWVFAEEKVDYAIVEAGLGGLLDGTNTVLRPDKICVITDIGLDHTEILGDTIAKITAQKAGIIHAGNRVFVRRQADEILQVVLDFAHNQHAALSVVGDEDCRAPDMLPVLQQHNWLLARSVLKYLQDHDHLTSLSQAQIDEVALQTPPGRWEIYRHNGKTIILDGAHNPQKLQALRDSLIAEHITSTALLANLVEAPEAKILQSLDILKLFTSHLIVTEFNAGQDLKSRRSLPAEAFASLARAAGIKSIDTEPNLKHALILLLARPETTLIITGSLYLISAVRKNLRQILGLDSE